MWFLLRTAFSRALTYIMAGIIIEMLLFGKDWIQEKHDRNMRRNRYKEWKQIFKRRWKS